jgi:hypothetical protein
MSLIGRVVLTILLCVVFPVTLLIDIFYAGGLSEGIVAAIRVVRRGRSSGQPD